MSDNELRKRLLQAKKTERIIFAATPELKQALEVVAQERCVSVSALITQAVLNELSKNRDLLEEVDG
ncbi:MAG: hypothetical protein PUD02_05915 [Eggerthellales bacterium]|nr:hypothetical protein [Eggerthellales bacterium]